MRTSNGSKPALINLGALGLVGIAAVHVVELPSKFKDVAYQGGLFVALAVACLIVASALIRSSGARLWWRATLVLGVAPLVSFAISRTIGLPNAPDDIGAWIEPTGTTSIVFEAFVILLAARALSSLRKPTTVESSPQLSRPDEVGLGRRAVG